MIRLAVLSATLLIFPASLPRGPASRPSLAEVGDSARAAWERRDLRAFLAPAAGGRLLVTLPTGGQSAPITPDQGRALLATYVQGTQEVATQVQGAREVDSLQGYVELKRKYRVVGIPGERESMILLGYRRGRSVWVLIEVRIGS